ncbi:MAG: hypothetical protein A2X94_05445 [Bdellovibrionales bacterium GWB1_55_8]|nr:MAG: hypothetical protein A2X94_05445 [Bdellovibrionales bacterium GWB1_55_8]
MRQKQISLRTASIAGLLLTFPVPPAHADFFLQHWENKHQSPKVLDISARLGAYFTEKNFDDSGSLEKPNDLNRYSRIDSDLALSWGLSRRLSVFGRSSWAHVELDHAVIPGNAFGLTDQTVGANFRIYESPILSRLSTALDLQIQLDFPAYDNAVAAAAGSPALGNGSVDSTAGAFLTVPVSQNTSRSILMTGGAGYTYRSSGFSAAIPWSITAEYRPATPERVFGSLGMTGTYSLLTDESPSLRPSSMSGGSLFTNAVNPSLATLKGAFGYQFTRGFKIFLHGSQSIAGQRSPLGFVAGFGIQAALGGQLTPLGSETEHPYANRGFVNYSLDAPVLRSDAQLSLVRVGKGRQDGVEVGQVFDVFEKNPANGDAVARGRVTAVRFDDSDVRILEVFKQISIDEGFVARRLIQ